MNKPYTCPICQNEWDTWPDEDKNLFENTMRQFPDRIQIKCPVCKWEVGVFFETMEIIPI